MRKVAIISAAGWKAAGREHGLLNTPESFLPLGDNTTPLSRVATTLSSRGFDVYVGVGVPGYPFNKYWPKYAQYATSGSPWAWEIIDYAGRYGEPVYIGDPGCKGSHDTLSKVLGSVDDFDKVVLARGDIILSPGRLESVLDKIKWPCQYQLCPNHSYFFLDRDTSNYYLNYIRSINFDGESTRDDWWKAMRGRYPRHAYYPDGHPCGSHAFVKNGVSFYGSDFVPGEWIDIDLPQNYTDALRMVKEGML